MRTVPQVDSQLPTLATDPTRTLHHSTTPSLHRSTTPPVHTGSLDYQHWHVPTQLTTYLATTHVSLCARSGEIIAAKLIQTGAQTCAADPNADCTLGDAVTAADCTASCEATLTQTVTTDAVGTGSCAPGTYSCMAGDGACPPEPSAAGRVGVWAVGGAAAALACSAFLMHQYH